MSNSFNSARVSRKSISSIFVFSLISFFFTSCNLSNAFVTRKPAPKFRTFSHVLPLSIQEKNIHLIEYQENKLKKNSTKKVKDSTDLIELALKN
jgi:hypothetical protein